VAAVDIELVTRICQSATYATTSGCGGVVDVATDPLDGSAWVRMTSWPRVQEATAQLQAYGLAVVERDACRLQVIGWDARLLRRRLGTLLAGVDDLRVEWDATAELVRYHRDRRAEATGEEPDPSEVLAEVERVLRDARPIPHTAPNVADVDSLLQLVEAAEDAYAQLIVQHVEHAAAVLEADAREHAAGPNTRMGLL
jgi:hypothetical protein